MPNYVDKENFLELIDRYQNNKDDEKAFYELSKIFVKIAKGVINKKKYYKYIEYNDLLLETCVACMGVIDKFDKNKISLFKQEKVNPFSFFNQVINFTIYNMLKANDKHRIKNVYLIDFLEKKIGNINQYDELSNYNDRVKELEVVNKHDINYFNEQFINYLYNMQNEIKKYGKVFEILMEYLIKFLRLYEHFDKKIFLDFIKENDIIIKEKQINKFFSILQKVLDMEEVLQMIYYK